MIKIYFCLGSIYSYTLGNGWTDISKYKLLGIQNAEGLIIDIKWKIKLILVNVSLNKKY